MLGHAMAPAVFAVALLACSSSQRSAGQSGGGRGNTAVAGRSIDAVLAHTPILSWRCRASGHGGRIVWRGSSA
jgi:hypothetical protein